MEESKDEKNNFGNGSGRIDGWNNWISISRRSAGGPHSGAQGEPAKAHRERRGKWVADAQRNSPSREKRGPAQSRDTPRSQAERWQLDEQREGPDKSPAESPQPSNLQRQAQPRRQVSEGLSWYGGRVERRCPRYSRL